MSKWQMVKLGEVCEIARGGSPRPIDKYITDDENGVNWIKIGDTVEGQKLITSTKQKIIQDGIKKSRQVYKGDFLLTNSMSFGKPFILDIDGCIHDGWLVISDKNNVFSKDYLYYILSSETLYNQFKLLAVGGVVNNLNSDIVRKVKIPLPPLEEQQKIAKNLDLASELVKLYKTKLQELDKLIQSVFYDMFGDPVTNEKGWEMVKFTDVMVLQRGFDLPISERNLTGEIDVYGSNGVLSKHDKSKICGGGVITGRSGTIGKVYYTFNDYWALNTTLFSKELKGNNIIYLAYLLERFNIKRFSTGTGVPTLNRNLVHNEKIISVPLPLQQKFADIVTKIEEQKSEVNHALQDAEMLYNSLMQEYFE